VCPITFRCANASATKAFAAASFVRPAAPSAETTSATASNSTDGPPANWKSASTRLSPPPAMPIRGATTFSMPPAAFTASRSFSTSDMSAPSDMRQPIMRPFSEGFWFAMMLSLGDGFRSVRVGLAASAFWIFPV
jgi:hypothetical protein